MAGQTHEVSIDRCKTLRQEPHTGHNRWHEAIAPATSPDPKVTLIIQRVEKRHRGGWARYPIGGAACFPVMLRRVTDTI